MQRSMPGASGMLRCIGSELDPGHVEMTRCLHEEEPVGATQLEELPVAAILADEIGAARELAPQHWFGAEVVRVAVAVATGKVIAGVIGRGIEPGCLGPAEAAAAALQYIAAADAEAEPVTGGTRASRARARELGAALRTGGFGVRHVRG